MPEAVDVAVVGGGVAGLVAAVEAGRAGASVVVFEASDVFGGCVGRVRLPRAELVLDAGAESFALRGGVVEPYLVGLGLGDEIVDPRPGGSWLAFPDAGGALAAMRMPRTGILGIPADPLAPEVARLIGADAAARAAAADRESLALPDGPVALGALVRSRMGEAVLERLVTPISAGVYSADPEILDVDAVAPGLVDAVRETGSLGAAVSRQLAARRAGSAVRGLRGGMHTLVDALLAEATRLGVALVPGAPVIGLAASGARSDVRTAAGSTLAGTVILAAPAAVSRPLLAGLAASVPDAFTEPWPTPASVELATLVLDAPALDAAPRGTGLLVARGTPGVTAKALTHASAKWPWLAERLPAGRHVVRLSYGRAGEENPIAGLDDAALARVALADAAALLGTPLDASALVDTARVRWRDALSHAALGQRARVDRLEAALAAVPGIEATGSWLAGTGLASVIPHARAAAARARPISP